MKPEPVALQNQLKPLFSAPLHSKPAGIQNAVDNQTVRYQQRLAEEEAAEPGRQNAAFLQIIQWNCSLQVETAETFPSGFTDGRSWAGLFRSHSSFSSHPPSPAVRSSLLPPPKEGRTKRTPADTLRIQPSLTSKEPSSDRSNRKENQLQHKRRDIKETLQI